MAGYHEQLGLQPVELRSNKRHEACNWAAEAGIV